MRALSAFIGTPFSASRTLCLLPFFVAGWLAHERGWLRHEALARPSIALRSVCWAVLGGFFALLWFTPNLRETWQLEAWLAWDAGYAELFENAAPFAWSPGAWQDLAGAGLRFGLLAACAVIACAVMMVMPRRESVITQWGTRSLYVYLLHGPIVRLVGDETNVMDWFASLQSVGVVALVLLGTALAALLSTRLVARVTRPLIDPRPFFLSRASG